MYVVLDNNQLTPSSDLVKVPDLDGVTLAPLAYVEIALRRNPQQSMTALQGINIRLGMEVVNVLETVSKLTAEQIQSFRPFIPNDSQTHTDWLGAVHGVPTSDLLATAQDIKTRNLDFCHRMIDRAQQFRQEVRNKKSADRFEGKERFDTLDEAIEEVPDFFESMIVSTISNGGQGEITVSSSAALCEAVLANPCLARLYRGIVSYLFSISRLWRDQRFNYDPNGTRDDWTDLMLPLYACTGDVILTADIKLRQLVKLVEPSGDVRALSVAELTA